jgi:hypothetical protein
MYILRILACSGLEVLLALRGVAGPTPSETLKHFEAGAVLKSAQLNALVDQVNHLQAALTAAQGEIASLRTDLQNLDIATTNVQALDAHIEFVPGAVNGLLGPHLVFTRVNVHIESGSKMTNDNGNLRGLGNLVVGYNEVPSDLQARASGPGRTI